MSELHTQNVHTHPLAACRLFISFLIFHISTFLSEADSSVWFWPDIFNFSKVSPVSGPKSINMSLYKETVQDHLIKYRNFSYKMCCNVANKWQFLFSNVCLPYCGKLVLCALWLLLLVLKIRTSFQPRFVRLSDLCTIVLK